MRRLGTILVLGALSLSLLSGCGDKTGYAKDGFAEGRLGDTMHTYFFDFTVNSAYLCDTYEGYTPIMEGYQLLVADVTVKNTNRESIPMYDTDFQVQWSDDSEDAYDVPITYYTDAVSDQQLHAIPWQSRLKGSMKMCFAAPVRNFWKKALLWPPCGTSPKRRGPAAP